MRSLHRSFGGGTALRCRLRGVGAGFLVLASMTALAACSTSRPGDRTEETATSVAATSSAPDPHTVQACRSFWGDPDYRRPLSRDVLDRAATAPEAGPEDPGFYARTGEDVENAFAEAPTALRRAAAPIADWMREQPERGHDADRDSFEDAWTGLARACAPVSDAALWAAGLGRDGAKPAALVCADVFDTPQTLTVFANANVLTSNMFKLVGRSPFTVPQQRMDDVRATAKQLTAEIDAVDDDAVRTALRHVRTPFQDALDGDLQSDGLQQPLEELGAACGDAGYDAAISPTDGEGEDDGGLV